MNLLSQNTDLWLKVSYIIFSTHLIIFKPDYSVRFGVQNKQKMWFLNHSP